MFGSIPNGADPMVVLVVWFAYLIFWQVASLN